MLFLLELLFTAALIVIAIIGLLRLDDVTTLFLKLMCKIGLSEPTHTWKDVD